MIRLAVHDPGLLTVEQRAAQFTLRDDLVRDIAGAIEGTPLDAIPQHRLVVGPAGSGKSMTLARLGDVLAVPSVLCSMPHGAADVAALWQQVRDSVSGVSAATEDALEALCEYARASSHGRLAVLIDGFDRVLAGIGNGEWALRESLSRRPEIVLVGSAARIPPSTYDYQGAFFDFFATHVLNAFDVAQSLQFLRDVAHAIEAAEVVRAIEHDPDRFAVLAMLTNGNPRALTLVLEASLLGGGETTARNCFEHVVDRSTPTFERCIDAISPHARVVFAALAAHWHPAHAKTIAARLGMPTNKVSTYLDRLSRDGLVDKVALPPGKIAGFQLRDRLCNLWFLRRGDTASMRRVSMLIDLLAGVSTDPAPLRGELGAAATDEWLAPELRLAMTTFDAG